MEVKDKLNIYERQLAELAAVLLWFSAAGTRLILSSERRKLHSEWMKRYLKQGPMHGALSSSACSFRDFKISLDFDLENRHRRACYVEIAMLDVLSISIFENLRRRTAP